MSKLSFRARALDATKPLPIYHAVDLPDLSEYNTINRTVPQMPTGMEKEEETERHLQDVIIAQQTNRVNKNVIIPTPEKAISVPGYEEIAAKMEKSPVMYIRVPGLTLDEDVPDYDLDSEDDEWLNRQTKEKPLSCLQFERMMDKLEKGSGNMVLSEREAQALLKDDEDLVLAVYDYWLIKRLKLGRSLIPAVKHERRDGSASGSNPYLSFRKRTEKMQTRKNRKNDETAYMQMQKLKRDLDKSFALSGLLRERENKKFDLAQVQMDIFKKRYLLEDWSGSIMTSLCPVATRSATSKQNSSVSESTWDGNSMLLKVEGDDDYDVQHVGRHQVLVSSGTRRKRKKKYFLSNVTESPIPLVSSSLERVPLDPLHSGELFPEKLPEDEEVNRKYAFKRRPHVKYHKARCQFEGWSWDAACPSPSRSGGGNGVGTEGIEFGCITTRDRVPRPKKLRFSRLTLSGEYVGLSRRRVGRGGRIMLDRATLNETDDLDMTLSNSEPMDISNTTPLAEVPSSSSGSLCSHTPLADIPISRTPSSLFPRGPSVTPSSGEVARVSSLASSQSTQVPQSSAGAATVGEGVTACGGGDAGEVLSGRKRGSDLSSLHFINRTPSPTSKREFPSLNLINQPLPYSDTSTYAPPTGLASQTLGIYSNQDFPDFRRIPSLSDCREEMTNFSSLPTSHFTLKPSSSDTELDEAPMSYWNQSVASDKYLYSSSLSWNQSCTGLGNEKYWQRQSASSNSRKNSNSPHLSSAPANYGGYHPNSTVRQKSHQQVQNYENTSSDQSVKNVSRSSLSVTDSKTIILTNTPSHSSHSTGTSEKEKRKVEDKMQQQPMQNHKLVCVGGPHKRGLTPSVERASKKLVGTNPVADSKSSADELTRSKSADDAKPVAGFGGDQVKNTLGGLARRGACGGLEQNKKGRTVASVNAVGETAGGRVCNAVGETVGGRVSNDEVKEPPGVEVVNSGSSLSNSVASSISSNPVRMVKEKGKPVDLKHMTSGDLKHMATKELVKVDVWEVNGPANMILSLNVASKRTKNLSKSLNKKPVAILATMESAKLVTSKFGSKPAVRKREDSGGSSTSATADMVTLSQPPLPPQGTGGVLIHTSANSRSGSSTPTILDGMLAQQKLGALSTAMAAGLSGVKVTELPSIKTGDGTIVSGVGGMEVKRTISNPLPDGIVGHVTSQVDHVTASVGTNGTNFQEMFSSTKRKLSESTERGLKQALAGFVKRELVKLPHCKVE